MPKSGPIGVSYMARQVPFTYATVCKSVLVISWERATLRSLPGGGGIMTKNVACMNVSSQMQFSIIFSSL